MDTSHLDALMLMLSNARSRLAMAKNEYEIEMRKIHVLQLEKEVKFERAFIGKLVGVPLADVSDDELLADLFSSPSEKLTGTAVAILATLSDSGPANIRELCDTLAATEPSAAREHVCQELHV